MQRAIGSNQRFIAPLYRTLRTPAMAVLAMLGVAATEPLRAHGRAAMELQLEVQGNVVHARTRLALRDLRHMVPMDGDGDGRLSPAEVEAARSAVATHLRQTLLVEQPGGQPCAGELREFQLADPSSVVLGLRYRCGTLLRRFTLQAGLFAGSAHAFEIAVTLRAMGRSQRHRLHDGASRLELDVRGQPRQSLDLLIAISLGVVLLSMLGTGIVAWLGLRRRRGEEARREDAGSEKRP